jgi:hypothetical protein
MPQVKECEISGRGVQSFPLLSRSLRFTNLCRSHLGLDVRAVRFAVLQGAPHISLDLILRNSQAIHVEQSSFVPTLSCSCQVGDEFACFAIPFRCLRTVLFHAPAIFVHLPKARLCVRMALRCGLLELSRGEFSVRSSVPVLVVGGAQPKLRLRVPLRSGSESSSLCCRTIFVLEIYSERCLAADKSLFG